MLRLLFAVFCLSLTVPLSAQTDGENASGDDEADSEIFERVVPVFDPGSHTRPICELGFSADQSKLITVGEDFTIQVWNVKTGERLDILRLPTYGHEQGFNDKAWDIAAISPNGRMVAIGGGQKKLSPEEKGGDRTKLILVDVVRRTIRHVNSDRGSVTALTFSPDGKRLAVAFSGKAGTVQIYSGASDESDKDLRKRKNLVLESPEAEKRINTLAFSPDGKRLVAADNHTLNLWKLDESKPILEKHADVRGHTTDVRWAPDGTTFVRTWIAYLNEPQGFEVFSATGENQRVFLFENQAPFQPQTRPWRVHFAGPQTLLFSTCTGKRYDDVGAGAFRFDLSTATGTKLLEQQDAGFFVTPGALSADGQTAAIVTSMGLDAVIYQVKDGTPISRCGAMSPIPSSVGWTKSGSPGGFAWSEQAKPGRFNASAEDLEVGFDLEKLEPVAGISTADYAVASSSLGEWKCDFQKGEGRGNELLIERAGKQMGTIHCGANTSEFTLVPQAQSDPLIAWNTRAVARGKSALTLAKIDGSIVARFRPGAVYFRSFAPSPDGRFLIATTGTHRMCVYPTNGSNYPLISVARAKGEWVAWSSEGYFTSSPGGSKMIGWAVSNGANQLATFYTADNFARRFRRPDLLRRAIQLGSMELALKKEETRGPNVEQLLPPVSQLKLVTQMGSRVVVQASTSAKPTEQPIASLRVLLDGRPLSGGIGYKRLQNGEPATARWELDIPPGQHELKLQVRSSDESISSSEALAVKIPNSPNYQPVLYRLCVGINEYQRSALNLNSAAKDANDVYGALEKYCVGADNRFGASHGTLLVNQKATRAGVLQAIANIRQLAKPGDLVVFLFAGHGIKQKDEYYLITHEGDPSESLKDRSLSGEDLRGALSDIECPVLLLLDACHSARSARSFRPATDDLSRQLTDDSAGVTVLAAAMAHEVASATEENGHFTAAFLKALHAGQSVPYDSYDHVLYIHHVYSVIFSEVRRATQGKQNPFLNIPLSAPPIAVRDIPTE